MDTELKEAVDYLKGQAQIGKALDDAWRLMENDTIRKLGIENAQLRSAIDEVIHKRDELQAEIAKLKEASEDRVINVSIGDEGYGQARIKLDEIAHNAKVRGLTRERDAALAEAKSANAAYREIQGDNARLRDLLADKAPDGGFSPSMETMIDIHTKVLAPAVAALTDENNRLKNLLAGKAQEKVTFRVMVDDHWFGSIDRDMGGDGPA